MEQIAVWEGYMETLKKKLAHIQRKCEKYGCDFHFQITGEEMRTIIDHDHVNPLTGNPVEHHCKYFLVEAEGTAIVNGWEYVASVESTEKGNIFHKSLIDVEIPERYRNSDPICEHCNSNRSRKYTSIIRNTETGEFKQIGNTCLKDYSGLSASFATLVASFHSILDEAQQEPSFGGGYSGDYYKTDEFLRYASETIKHFGYTKSSDPDATGDLARRIMNYFNGKITSKAVYEATQEKLERINFNAESPEASQMVKDALEWLSNQVDNDYIHNLKVATSLDYVKPRNMNLIASLFASYSRGIEIKNKRKEEQKQKKLSKHIGNIGDKITIEVADFRVLTSWENCYDGYNVTTTYLYQFTDPDGNIFTWKTSSQFCEGMKEITGKIKDHTEWNGIKQTILTRCKVKGA